MRPALSYFVQAVSFGVAHWQGLPGGLVGVAVTGVFAIVAVWLHRHGGLTASVLAHVVADLVIFGVASRYVLFTAWWGQPIP